MGCKILYWCFENEFFSGVHNASEVHRTVGVTAEQNVWDILRNLSTCPQKREVVEFHYAMENSETTCSMSAAKKSGGIPLRDGKFRNNLLNSISERGTWNKQSDPGATGKGARVRSMEHVLNVKVWAGRIKDDSGNAWRIRSAFGGR